MIGVLALQGDWAAHRAVLHRLGAATRPVRRPSDLAGIDALVLPGGESTTMLSLMADEHLDSALRQSLLAGLPTLATCAGVILLAREVDPTQPSLSLLDVSVARNAYGRQVHSAVATVCFDSTLGEPSVGRGIFIRAPRITRVGDGVRVLATRDGEPVLVEHGALLAATFHPELTGDDRIHRRLLVHLEAHNG